MSEIDAEKIRIEFELKKYKTECGEAAFLYGEIKQIIYMSDAIKNIIKK
ncbi:MAG: hypothetical protein ACHQ1D_00050 [Nitrososphaerales archaeon]